MKRSNLFIIGIVTAIVTIISLNVFVGRSYGGYNHWRHRGLRRALQGRRQK